MKTDKKEVNAIVLDVLLKGHPEDPRPIFKREPLVQAVGIAQFKLLELVPKKLDIGIHENVYIGDGEREKIERVKRRIGYEELTQTAKVELPFVVEKIVQQKESEYVQFFHLDQPEIAYASSSSGNRQETYVGDTRGAGEEAFRELCRDKPENKIHTPSRKDDNFQDP